MAGPNPIHVHDDERDGDDEVRVGYSFWGSLADVELDANGERVSAPCGNATYSWAVVHAAVERGHEVWPLQLDRDEHAVRLLGERAFASFSPRHRMASWQHLNDRRSSFQVALPDLDVILVEWRWPIPGRNTPEDRGTPSYQPDFDRQTAILRHYKERGTRVVLWDLDYKLTPEDEVRWEPSAVFETSIKPKKGPTLRRRVEFPIPVGVLLQHETLPPDPSKAIVYVGNRYERDEQVDEWIEPMSRAFPGAVHLYGNWTNEPHRSVCAKRWPRVVTHDRIGVAGFREAYGRAGVVPLLSKREYAENGFVTPRPWEALMFGALPVGLKGHLGIGSYVWQVARDVQDLRGLALRAVDMSKEERHKERESLAARLSRCDATRFIDELERVAR